MSFDLSKIARANILALKPYSSARDEYHGTAEVYLDANENPFNSTYNRYPDPMQWALKEKLAKLKGLKKEQIILGNGSDEIIDLLIRSFCNPTEDEIIILPPTYGMYEVYANINQVKIVELPLNENFDIDEAQVLKAIRPQSKLIFICSPNNPSGNSLDPTVIKNILQNFKGLVVLDEAYIDFSAQESWSAYLDLYPNLVVMQTLSKAWGLAGIRLGIGLASKEIVALLNKVKPPYNINLLSQEKALSALDKLEEKNEQVDLIIDERDKYIAIFKKLAGVKRVYPSDANFILIQVENATLLYKHLLNEGIVVRNRTTVLGCSNCLRLTIGTAEENKKLLAALNKGLQN